MTATLARRDLPREGRYRQAGRRKGDASCPRGPSPVRGAPPSNAPPATARGWPGAHPPYPGGGKEPPPRAAPPDPAPGPIPAALRRATAALPKPEPAAPLATATIHPILREAATEPVPAPQRARTRQDIQFAAAAEELKRLPRAG